MKLLVGLAVLMSVFAVSQAGFDSSCDTICGGDYECERRWDGCSAFINDPVNNDQQDFSRSFKEIISAKSASAAVDKNN